MRVSPFIIHHSSFIISSRRNRRAITLLEVLISLFIIAIGLLGVAALLPIAAHQLNIAQRLDRGATLGQSAFHDIKNRGWLQPQNWLLNYVDTTGANPNPILTGGAYSPIVTYNGTSNIRELPFSSSTPFQDAKRYPIIGPPTDRSVNLAPPFVIDPLWTSYPNNPPVTTATQGIVQTMPQFAALLGTSNNPAPAIPRLTLRQFASSDTAMTYALADRLFRGNDDVEYFRPDDQQDRPLGIEHGGTTGTFMLSTYQQYAGDYSCFFTVAPDTRELQSVSASQVGKYRVSVAVVYQRKLAVDVTDGTDQKPGEGMVFVNIPSGGTSQGGVTVSVDGTNDYQRAVIESIRPNEWLMLTGWITDGTSSSPASPDFLPDDQYTSPFPTGTQRPVLDWFRVVAISDVYPGTGTAIARDITLEGPDWASGTGLPFVDANDTNLTNGLTVYGTVINDVVAIYSKTIELEGISRWSQ